MRMTNNPTAMSAVVSEEQLALASGGSRRAAVASSFAMPVLIAAFATYLLVGILTMEVPAAAVFPGPQFFPALITAGLYLFAALLALSALRELRSAPATEDAPRGRTVRLDWPSLAWVVGSFLAFAFLLQVLGWIIAAALLFWCVARGFGSRRAIFDLLVGLTVSSLSYIAFDMALGMSLPSGVLGGGF